MILTVKAAPFLRGRVRLPSSKSYSIRAFFVASLGGVSNIINPSDCDDAQVASSIAKQLGSRVVHSTKNTFQITAFQNKIKSTQFNVGESGTALRFLLPLLAAQKGRFKVGGQGTLKGRPNLSLLQALRQMGARISGCGTNESIPIVVNGGNLNGGKITIDGALSSQFISALLIACPQLREDTTLMLSGKKIVSQTYLTMTERILELSGIKVERKSPRLFFIKGNQKFEGLKNFTVPSDYGLAAFLLAAVALVPSEVALEGFLDDDLIQADGEIFSFLRKMGVHFTKTRKLIEASGPYELTGGNFSLKNCPDLLPIMAVLALFAKGKTRLYDVGHARVKESDRISDLRGELLKIGAKVDERQNEVTIFPRQDYRNNVLLNPHSDHRLAMAFTVLGLKVGVRIKDIECVSKSYPRFVKDFKKIGAPVSCS